MDNDFSFTTMPMGAIVDRKDIGTWIGIKRTGIQQLSLAEIEVLGSIPG